MDSFYRIRALVDSSLEEEICLGNSVAAAMEAFEKVEAKDTGEKFGTYGIDVAMVHRITFGEAGPVFEDVTYQVDGEKWARADFDQCKRFFQKA